MLKFGASLFDKACPEPTKGATRILIHFASTCPNAVRFRKLTRRLAIPEPSFLQPLHYDPFLPHPSHESWRIASEVTSVILPLTVIKGCDNLHTANFRCEF